MLERTPSLSNFQETLSNEFQKLAIEKLKTFSLTEAHFKGCDWFNSRTHVYALGYLMIAKHSPASGAIKELEGLNTDQLIGLMSGLSKRDITGLSKYQMKAIRHFSNWGLTAAQLRHKDWFDSKLHYDVLHKLIQEDFLKPDTALQNMADLNETQLSTLLHHSLSIDELRGLSKWELMALCVLKDYGLSHAHIKNNNWLNSQSQINALETLVTTLDWTPESALNEIERLDEKQLSLVMMGFSRKDILLLTPEQLDLFINHRERTMTIQLTPRYLINKPWFNSIFHLQAVIHLLERDEEILNDINSALTELDGMSEEQAKVISMGLKRDDVMDMNSFQLIAFRELKNYKITLDHLRGKNWFNSQTHVKTLSEVLKSPPYLTPDDAMRMLENSDEEMANEIFRRHEEFPYDEKIEKFTLIYYTKVLVEIVKNASDHNFHSATELLTVELDKLLKSLQVSTVPQEMRKEIATSIVTEIQNNTQLSLESKSNLLKDASKHVIFGHMSKVSHTMNMFGNYLTSKNWNTNTQNILLEAAKAFRKTASATPIAEDSHSFYEEDEETSDAMPSPI